MGVWTRNGPRQQPRAWVLGLACIAAIVLILRSSIDRAPQLWGATPATHVAHQVDTSIRATSSEQLWSRSSEEWLAGHDMAWDETAWQTRQAQRWIHDQLNPSECAGKRWMLAGGNGAAGLGSYLHTGTAVLAAALEAGWLFDWAPQAAEYFTDPTTCGDVQNWNCHFVRPSHCPVSMINSDTSLLVSWESMQAQVGIHAAFVPSHLARMVRSVAPQMSDHALKYWWRGQAVAYLMRLRSTTHAAVRAMRDPRSDHTPLVVLAPRELEESADGARYLRDLRTRFPFPPGVVHAHVRHGDKHTEMTLLPTSRYFEAASSLVDLAPFRLRRTIFISTEDTNVLAEAASYVQQGWVVMYTNMSRVNENPMVQFQQIGASVAGVTTRTHILQLMLSLECDAWVTTRASNWNRLLDELRCMWVGKCTHPVAEVGLNAVLDDYNW